METKLAEQADKPKGTWQDAQALVGKLRDDGSGKNIPKQVLVPITICHHMRFITAFKRRRSRV